MTTVNPPKLLIFPFDGDAAGQMQHQAHSLGIEVACAHSDRGNDHFLYLPYVSDRGFIDALRALITTERITHLYSPHPVVWASLDDLIRQGQLSLSLLQPSPYEQDLSRYRLAVSWAQKQLAVMPATAVSRLGSDALDTLSGLHLGFFTIPGQSDLAKLEAIVELMGRCPAGDIVEIGSLFGRSAYAFAYLARRLNLGHVLCVDPWSNQEAGDQGDSAKLVNTASRHRRYNDVHHYFRAIRQAFNLDNLDWLRSTSCQGAESYRAGTAFSRTESTGTIALLHIDGNHALEAVSADIAAWSPWVGSGGWILIDDYCWSFGSGPRQAGDHYLQQHADLIEQAYCLGDTLYIQKK